MTSFTDSPAPASFENALPILRRIAELTAEMRKLDATVTGSDPSAFIRNMARMRSTKPYSIYLDEAILLASNLPDIVRNWPISEAQDLVLAIADGSVAATCTSIFRQRRGRTGHDRLEAATRFEKFMAERAPAVDWMTEDDLRRRMAYLLRDQTN